MAVKQFLAAATILIAALSVDACRQADGPLPPATGTVPNELGDIGRDLLYLSSGRPDGAKDLADDLSHYAEETAGGQPAAAEFSRRLSEALAGKMFTSQQALQLAHTCWVAVAGRQLSEKQVEQLQNEMQSELTAMGVAVAQAQSVAAQVGVVQQAVTQRHRRWYEVL